VGFDDWFHIHRDDLTVSHDDLAIDDGELRALRGAEELQPPDRAARRRSRSIVTRTSAFLARSVCNYNYYKIENKLESTDLRRN